jgi:hypothetical protein
VSTLGERLTQLERLLRSVQAQAPDARVLIADQSQGRAVGDVADGFSCAQVLTSGRGLSRGRNACLETLEQDEPAVVLFPNDNTWYPPGVLTAIQSRMESAELDVLSGRLEYRDGSAPFPVPLGRTNLRPENAAFAMSATLAVNSSWFTRGIRFDESLGAGARSPYQAGEETDLLLTLLAQGARAELHADLVIFGEDATGAMPLSQQLRKTWGYSRAHTYVLRRHGLSRKELIRALVRPLMRSLLSVVVFDLRQAVIAMTRFLGRCRGAVPW